MLHNLSCLETKFRLLCSALIVSCMAASTSLSDSVCYIKFSISEWPTALLLGRQVAKVKCPHASVFITVHLHCHLCMGISHNMHLSVESFATDEQLIWQLVQTVFVDYEILPEYIQLLLDPVRKGSYKWTIRVKKKKYYSYLWTFQPKCSATE